jgi:hypothetical protein
MNTLRRIAAYKVGALKLEDVAGFNRDPRWGPVGYERALADIPGPDNAKKWRTLAIDRGAISERMKQQWADPRYSHDERDRQIAAMSDRQLRVEVTERAHRLGI